MDCKKPDGTRLVVCDFCGMSSLYDAPPIARAGGVAICKSCAELALRVLQDGADPSRAAAGTRAEAEG